jgi:hypothetical protein
MGTTTGSPLPDIKSTTSQTTAAPGFYTDYLNNLSTQGQAAGNNAQFVGATGLQNQAFGNVAQNVGNYQPAFGAAAQGYGAAQGTDIAGAAQPYMNAAAAPTSSTVSQFMSPYTQNVVNSIGALGQQNIAQNIAPQTTAGIVGAGQFGSQRGADALSQTLANAGLGITGQQAAALQSGYGQALQAAQNQAQLYGNLGQTAGQQAQAQGQLQLAGGQAQMGLGMAQQQAGLADVNALSTLGAQQQTIGQNQQLFPLQTLSAESNLLRGYSMPTSVTSQYVGPGQAGQYSASDLSTLTGLGALSGAISQTPLGGAIGTGVSNLLGRVSNWFTA